VPSHELDNDGWLDEFSANTADEQPAYGRRSPLSPKAAWPASDPLFDLNTPLSELGLADGPTEARLLAARAVGLAPASPPVPEPPQVQLLRLAKKAFPDLTLRPGMYCDVNGVSGTSPWRFVLKASGMSLGAAKLTASGDSPEACIEAMITQVRPIERQVAADRQDAMRRRRAA
jgi:hypothetical protein